MKIQVNQREALPLFWWWKERENCIYYFVFLLCLCRTKHFTYKGLPFFPKYRVIRRIHNDACSRSKVSLMERYAFLFCQILNQRVNLYAQNPVYAVLFFPPKSGQLSNHRSSLRVMAFGSTVQRSYFGHSLLLPSRASSYISFAHLSTARTHTRVHVYVSYQYAPTCLISRHQHIPINIAPQLHLKWTNRAITAVI